MRKWTIAVLAGVILVSAAAAAEVSREDFERLQQHVREQAEVIGQLRGRIAVLEKRVEEMEKGDTDEDTDGDGRRRDGEAIDRGGLQEIGTPLSQWTSEHYVNFDWIEREGWDVPVGRKNGAVVLSGHKNARRSRLIFERQLKGHWAARLQVGGVEGVWVELVQDRQKKKGYEVRLPDRRHVRLDLQRKDGEITAVINGETEATVSEKRFGADPEGPVQLAIVVKSQKRAYVRDLDVYVERGRE